MVQAGSRFEEACHSIGLISDQAEQLMAMKIRDVYKYLRRKIGMENVNLITLNPHDGLPWS